jgi:hypothetical protein
LVSSGHAARRGPIMSPELATLFRRSVFGSPAESGRGIRSSRSPVLAARGDGTMDIGAASMDGAGIVMVGR